MVMRRPLRRAPLGRKPGPGAPAPQPAAPAAGPAPARPPAPPPSKEGLTLSEWTDVIQKHPDFAGAYAERGTLLYKTGRIDNALYDFNQALKLEPNNFKALFWRGWLQLARKKPHEAAADLQRAAA